MLTKEDVVPDADRKRYPPQGCFRSGASKGHIYRGRGKVIMAKTSDALKILGGVSGNSASIRQGLASARMNLDVAQMIYDARTKARMSQSELANLIGTRQSVIARLEDADYTGHSLSMLQRIANALGQRVELRFVRTSPKNSKPAGGSPISNRLLRPA
jgi:DNA-binding XRE family transcriptional regulator